MIFATCAAVGQTMVMAVTNSSSQLQFINNGVIELGVDMQKGCSVVSLMDLTGKTNVINTADLGREVQPSFYAGPEGYGDCIWSDTSWDWNPVGSGDAYGHPSNVVSWNVDISAAVLSCSIIPMQWACDNVPCDCTFDMRYELPAGTSYVKASVTLHNQRSDTADYGPRDQELPAVYTNGFLYRLLGYMGSEPWTNGALTEYDTGFSDFWVPGKVLPTEPWMCLASDDDYCLGVYAPGGDIYSFLGGFSGGESGKGHGGTSDQQTGYLAPLASLDLPFDATYAYDYYLILGDISTVRGTVYNLAGAGAGVRAGASASAGAGSSENANSDAVVDAAFSSRNGSTPSVFDSAELESLMIRRTPIARVHRAP